MSVNSISSIYNSLYSSLSSKSADLDEKKSNGSGASSLSDILELYSSDEELSSYLNYDSSGNYSRLTTTLLDYLTSADDGTSKSGNSNSLADILDSNCSENTTSNIFDYLINANAAKVENLMEIAQEKLDAEGSTSE